MSRRPDTRARLLTAARDYYREHGMQGFSLRQVAQIVGVSAPAVYRHFDSRDALLSALVDDSFRRFGDYLARAAQADTPEDRMDASGRAYVDFALENPGEYHLMFIAPPALDEGALPDNVRRRMQQTFAALIQRVRECMDSGWRIAPGDPEPVAQAIWALSHGMVSLYLAGKWGDDEAAFRADVRHAHVMLATGYMRRPGLTRS